MKKQPATLHLFCGKIASGKSTLAARLAESAGAVLIAEDDWLSTLYPEEIKTINDLQVRSRRLEHLLSPHVRQLLIAGADVVLDFHGNTKARRDWMRGILEGLDTQHVFHLLEASDDLCKERLRIRNASGTHPYDVSDAIFDEFTRYFDPPNADEGWNIVRPRSGQANQ